jgi:phosphatidylglycerol---prolipoprotein diacylglyceryl transferase
MDNAYLGFVVAGAAVGALNFLLAWRRAGLPLGGRVVAFAGLTVAAGVAGARLYALVEQGWRWDLAASLDGGFRLPGGVVGLLVGLVAWRRLFVPEVPLGLIGDLGAIAVQFGLVVVRLGCLAAGCCFGTVCDLPWAIRFPRGTVAADVHASLGWIAPGDTTSLPVHPLQLYFLLLHLALGLFLLWFARRKAYDGQVLLLGLLLGQGGKALLESFRQPIAGMPARHLQLASALLAAAAAVALVAMAARQKRRHTQPPFPPALGTAPGGALR